MIITKLLSVEVSAEWESYLLDVVQRAMAEVERQPEWARDRHRTGSVRLTLERVLLRVVKEDAA